MATRLPRALTRKRAELAFERQTLKNRLTDVERELAALDYALKVAAPGWAPPKKVSRPARAGLVPRGGIAPACLQLLRQRGELSTPELAKLAAARFRLSFGSKKAEQSFASTVTMALRRYERQGIAEVTGRDGRTGAIRWRLRTGADGRVTLAGKAA